MKYDDVLFLLNHVCSLFFFPQKKIHYEANQYVPYDQSIDFIHTGIKHVLLLHYTQKALLYRANILFDSSPITQKPKQTHLPI